MNFQLDHKASFFSLHWFVWTLIFAVVYGLEPLFSSNQNQYLLYGLAKAGEGLLAGDWMANTTDPVPLFSGITYLTARFAHPLLFYGYFIFLAGIYFYSVSGIARTLFPAKAYWTSQVFSAALLLMHSSWVGNWLFRLTGKEFLDLFSNGVARQYALDGYFQPSLFGVLMLLAVYQFLREKPYHAVALLAICASFHSGSLFSAGSLTLAFMLTIYLRERSLAAALKPGVIALILVLPILVYVLINFNPFGGELLAEARRIHTEFRTPHHMIISRLGTETFYFRLAIVATALFLLRKTALFPIWATITAIAVSASIVQVLSGSSGLGMLYPWRLSVVLVPVSSAIILAWWIEALAAWLPGKIQQANSLWRYGAAGIVLILILGGFLHTRGHFNWYEQRDHTALMRFAETHRQSGNVYLVPGLDLLAFDNFRLESGVPIVVDFKSVPYKDIDTIEWYKRIQDVKQFYDADTINCELLRKFQDEYKLTHVVLPAGHTAINCPALSPVYSDEHYLIYFLAE